MYLEVAAGSSEFDAGRYDAAQFAGARLSPHHEISAHNRRLDGCEEITPKVAAVSVYPLFKSS
jgi:hypothetical protein